MSSSFRRKMRASQGKTSMCLCRTTDVRTYQSHCKPIPRARSASACATQTPTHAAAVLSCNFRIVKEPVLAARLLSILVRATHLHLHSQGHKRCKVMFGPIPSYMKVWISTLCSISFCISRASLERTVCAFSCCEQT